MRDCPILLNGYALLHASATAKPAAALGHEFAHFELLRGRETIEKISDGGDHLWAFGLHLGGLFGDQRLRAGAIKFFARNQRF